MRKKRHMLIRTPHGYTGHLLASCISLRFVFRSLFDPGAPGLSFVPFVFFVAFVP